LATYTDLLVKELGLNKGTIFEPITILQAGNPRVVSLFFVDRP
jgi:hypothetical protein